MPHRDFLSNIQARTNTVLDKVLPAVDLAPQRLHQAMRYSALNPGKRIRPALVYATGEMLAAEPENLDIAAVSVELIHAYSLIHDDLPCMDDDDLRRGIPTCHIKFDEATAVLAGDALQTLAFELLSQPTGLGYAKQALKFNLSDHQKLLMLHELTKASGSLGMGGGQAIDLEMTDVKSDLATLESMHQMKTGALINASVKMGFIAMAHVACHQVIDELGHLFLTKVDVSTVEIGHETQGHCCNLFQ